MQNADSPPPPPQGWNLSLLGSCLSVTLAFISLDDLLSNYETSPEKKRPLLFLHITCFCIIFWYQHIYDSFYGSPAHFVIQITATVAFYIMHIILQVLAVCAINWESFRSGREPSSSEFCLVLELSCSLNICLCVARFNFRQNLYSVRLVTWETETNVWDFYDRHKVWEFV